MKIENIEEKMKASPNPIRPEGKEIQERVNPISPANFTSPIPRPFGRNR